MNIDLRGEIGNILTSRIPLGGSLAIYLLLEQFRGKYKSITVCLDQSEASFGGVLVDQDKLIHISYSKRELSFSESLLKALEELSLAETDSVDVVFGDTLNLSLDCDDSIIVSATSNRSRWMSVQRRDNKLEFELGGLNSEGLVVAGAFSFSRAALFTEILMNNSSDRSQEFFFSTLREYDLEISNGMKLVVSTTWQDIGHLDTYFQTKRSLLSDSSRVFNSIKMDSTGSRIIKSSENIDKIQSEIKWFQALPEDLKTYTPSFSPINELNGYSLQFLPGPTVAENWISGNDDDVYWGLVFEACTSLLSSFNSYVDSSKSNLMKELFIDKFDNRLEELSEIYEIRQILEGNTKVNGIKTPNLNRVRDQLHTTLSSLLDRTPSTVMHGDLFFGNLILDRRMRDIYCFDPRGFHIKNGIYGNQIYDLAKMSHSIDGSFDLIAANLFSLNSSVGSIDFTLADSTGERAQDMAREWLRDYTAESTELDQDTINFLGSTLLLSATPLHYDSRKRQMGLVSQSLLNLSKIL